MQYIKHLKNFYLSWISAIIIIVLSLVPIHSDNSGGFLNFEHADKVVHFILYLGLTFIIFYEMTRYKSGVLPLLFIPVLISFSYGGIIEILQIFQPGRSGEIFDLLADLAGGLIAIPLFLIFRKIFLIPKTRFK